MAAAIVVIAGRLGVFSGDGELLRRYIVLLYCNRCEGLASERGGVVEGGRSWPAGGPKVDVGGLLLSFFSFWPASSRRLSGVLLGYPASGLGYDLEETSRRRSGTRWFNQRWPELVARRPTSWRLESVLTSSFSGQRVRGCFPATSGCSFRRVLAPASRWMQGLRDGGLASAWDGRSWPGKIADARRKTCKTAKDYSSMAPAMTWQASGGGLPPSLHHRPQTPSTVIRLPPPSSVFGRGGFYL